MAPTGLQQPSIKVLPEDASARVGYDLVQGAFGDGAPGTLTIVVNKTDAKAASAVLADDTGIAGAMPVMPAGDGSPYALIQAVPTVDPSDPALSDTVDRLRADLPSSAYVGGAAVENLDLKTQLDDSTPLVIGVILALGFLLLLVALQAPLIALLGTLASLLSTAAAFGVAHLVFQKGWGAGFMGFESQGFLDAWAPVFFFAMIFAIAMDYTVFLLASAKEHFEHSGDPKEAMVGSLSHSGRVIFAGRSGDGGRVLHFALSGPLPPRRWAPCSASRSCWTPSSSGSSCSRCSCASPARRRAVRCKTCGKITWAGGGQHTRKSRPASRLHSGAPAGTARPRRPRPLARVAAGASSAGPERGVHEHRPRDAGHGRHHHPRPLTT